MFTAIYHIIGLLSAGIHVEPAAVLNTIGPITLFTDYDDREEAETRPSIWIDHPHKGSWKHRRACFYSLHR